MAGNNPSDPTPLFFSSFFFFSGLPDASQCCAPSRPPDAPRCLSAASASPRCPSVAPPIRPAPSLPQHLPAATPAPTSHPTSGPPRSSPPAASLSPPPAIVPICRPLCLAVVDNPDPPEQPPNAPSSRLTPELAVVAACTIHADDAPVAALFCLHRRGNTLVICLADPWPPTTASWWSSHLGGLPEIGLTSQPAPLRPPTPATSCPFLSLASHGREADHHPDFHHSRHLQTRLHPLLAFLQPLKPYFGHLRPPAPSTRAPPPPLAACAPPLAPSDPSPTSLQPPLACPLSRLHLHHKNQATSTSLMRRAPRVRGNARLKLVDSTTAATSTTST